MKKNLLITGGGGFIGNYVIDYLYEKYSISVIGRRNDIEKIKTRNNHSCTYYPCDYSYSQINELLEKINPEAVIHLAAKRLDKHLTTPEGYIDNLSCSNNIFQSCLKRNIENVIYISTIGLYSKEIRLPWQETDHPRPLNPYALSKQWVEQAANYYNQKGLKIKTLRLGQVIGLGEREGYALQVYLDNAIKGTPIIVFGQCKGKRHYIYAKDVAAAIKASLNSPNQQGVFNIGMNTVYGFDELAQTINTVFGNRSEIIYNRDAKADENIYQMSIEKAKMELGWRPKYDLHQTYSDINQEIEQLNDGI